jgi:hypothetical protein
MTTYKIESVKHFLRGVFVMVLNTKTNEVNEMTFDYLQEANDYLNALNKVCKS